MSRTCSVLKQIPQKKFRSILFPEIDLVEDKNSLLEKLGYKIFPSDSGKKDFVKIKKIEEDFSFEISRNYPHKLCFLKDFPEYKKIFDDCMSNPNSHLLLKKLITGLFFYHKKYKESESTSPMEFETTTGVASIRSEANVSLLSSLEFLDKDEEEFGMCFLGEESIPASTPRSTKAAARLGHSQANTATSITPCQIPF